jgi:hypothetical protein
MRCGASGGGFIMEVVVGALLLLIGCVLGYGARASVSRWRRTVAAERRFRARKARPSQYMTLEIPRNAEPFNRSTRAGAYQRRRFDDDDA